MAQFLSWLKAINRALDQHKMPSFHNAQTHGLLKICSYGIFSKPSVL